MTTCKWCSNPPIESHIASKLTLKVARKYLPAEFDQLRPLMQPLKKVQDIAKKPFLCQKCDGSFSAEEGIFRNKLYEPLLSGKAKSFDYGEWLQKIIVFTSWKELAMNLHRLKELVDSDVEAEALKAAQNWEDFLRGKRSDPGNYEHHLFLTWFVEKSEVSDIHWRIMRSVFECTLIPAKDGLIVWTTVPGCVFVSLIYSRNVRTWDCAERTRVGLAGSFDHTQPIPGQLVRDWLNNAEIDMIAKVREVKLLKSGRK